jgi:GntR family transcriptional regulator
MQAADFSLEPASALPVYVQLREQVLRALAAGRLAPGVQLPTVRQIAVHLGVNPNTVNRAYIELERDGVVTTARGRGTFVADTQSRPNAELADARLRDIARRAIGEARSLGFTADEFSAALANVKGST